MVHYHAVKRKSQIEIAKVLSIAILCLVSGALAEVNVGPLFEYDPDARFTAVRPFWSSTPTTEDFVWPLGTWHTEEDAFWYRFLFLAYGHEGSFNLFPFWFSGRDRETDAFHWAAFPFYGSHPHLLLKFQS